jgi:hypothetical protein
MYGSEGRQRSIGDDPHWHTISHFEIFGLDSIKWIELNCRPEISLPLVEEHRRGE